MFFSGLVLRIKIKKRWTSLTDYVDFCSILHGLQIAEYSTWLVPKIMAKHNMNEIIAVTAGYHCFEDFDYRKSRQKIDFYRK